MRIARVTTHHHRTDFTGGAQGAGPQLQAVPGEENILAAHGRMHPGGR